MTLDDDGKSFGDSLGLLRKFFSFGSDDELDGMFPEGYKVLPPPAGYVPLRTPARKLTATPTPLAGAGGAPVGFYMQKEEAQSSKYMDAQPKGGNLPFLKPEDAQYFDKLLVDVDEELLSSEELKERKIMTLLLKVGSLRLQTTEKRELN